MYMLRTIIILFIIAIIAGLLGFTKVAQLSTTIARLLITVAIFMFAAAFILAMVQ